MRSYIADVRLLLQGCLRELLRAAGLSAVSVVLDLVCITVLPTFVMLALSRRQLPDVLGPKLGGALSDVSLPAMSLAVLCLFLLRAGVMLYVGSELARLSETIRERLVGRLMQGFLSEPYESAIAHPVTTGITYVTHFSLTFARQLALPLLRLALDCVTIVGILGFVALIEPRAVLLSAPAFLLAGLLYQVSIRKNTARNAKRFVALQTRLMQQVSQALSAPREVRVFGLKTYFTQQIHENLRETAGTQAWTGAIFWFPRALGELTLIGLAITYMIIKSRSGADVAIVTSSLSMLAFAGLRLLPAFAQSLTGIGFLQNARPTARSLANQLRRTTARSAEPASSMPIPEFQKIELSDVRFGYAGAPAEVLKGISLTILRGQSIGVMGPSGSGKSTLGDLLLGLLVPRGGTVTVDGRELNLNSDQWWRHVGFVPQSPYIANDTILRNVAYGIPDDQVDRAAAEQAIRLAQLESVVRALPEGVNTILGDAGVKLSGGQRQRVAIARALYLRRDFLVLDEATSALDAETEKDVITAIEALKGRVTTFLIAHRLSTLQGCDVILELRDGRVVEAQGIA